MPSRRIIMVMQWLFLVRFCASLTIAHRSSSPLSRCRRGQLKSEHSLRFRGRRRAGIDLDHLVETSSMGNHRMIWNKEQGVWTYEKCGEDSECFAVASSPAASGGSFFELLFMRTFIPEGVTKDYFTYSAWKMLQRLISGTVNVFGVQAMLMALGVRSKGALGMAAATSWVLKDALGKVGRITWAGRMGNRFDFDAKRWRFRSSILFAVGNGLEIITYVFPASFLALATTANLLKQISMLTSSATRNAIYRSFAAEKNNIGELSAKSEAQIAVVDLLGMVCGICLSRALGASRSRIGAAYVLLSCADLFTIYKEIRSVVFKDLNFERLSIVLGAFVANPEGPVLSPAAVARAEHIFLNPDLDGVFRVFAQLPKGAARPDFLRPCLAPFEGEKYAALLDRAGDPFLVVHTEARSVNTAKAMLAYFLLRRLVQDRRAQLAGGPNEHLLAPEEAAALVAQAQAQTTALYPAFLRKLGQAGWANERFMLPVPRRLYWDLGEGAPASAAPASAAPAPAAPAPAAPAAAASSNL